jgi:proton-dependent oligopeptide transporter, POT family
MEAQAAPRSGANAIGRQPRSFLGYPRAAWLVIGVEFWERFSFYGMLAILALFLTADAAHGGFGWSSARALALVGAYSGAMYAFPAFGGYLADRVLGRRHAVTLGASVMLLGQWLLVAGAYTASTSGFYAAIFLLILGNALMKSTLVVLCGETFRPDDPRREGAFAYYYLGISVGAMLSGIAVGLVSERLGWAYGFAVGAIGMAIAFSLYVVFAPRWLREVGGKGPLQGAAQLHGPAGTRGGASETWLRIGLVLALAALLCAFSTGWFQMYGSWTLFVARSVNRSIGSFSVPVPWFSSINAIVVIAVAPLVAELWIRMAARNRVVDIVQKYFFALVMAALGNLLMYAAGVVASHGAQAPLWMPLLAVSLLGLGEIVAWTATYGVVSRAAPAGFASMTMGAWYLLTLGLGGYLSGVTGRWVDSVGFAATFAGVATVMALIAVVALMLRGPLLKLASRAGVTL